MRLTASGFVGIGSTNPDSRLTIQGLSAFKNTSGTTYGWIGVGSSGLTAFGTLTNNEMFIRGDNSLVLGTLGAENMRILNNGNVGIGATNPAQRLHIGTIGGTPATLAIQTVRAPWMLALTAAAQLPFS